MEETLDLRKVIGILKRRILLILVSVLVAAVLAAAVSNYLLTPVYESSTQILVNQERAATVDAESNSIDEDLQLINTYSVIINSPIILAQVIESLNLNLSIAEMKRKIVVSSASDSQVIDISVRDENSETASEIVNTIAVVFKEQIQEVMNVNNVTILSAAAVKENQDPVFPNYWLNIISAAAVGLLIGVGIAFLLDYLDTSVKNQQDVKRLLNVPLLAVISPINQQGDKSAEKSTLALKEKEA